MRLDKPFRDSQPQTHSRSVPIHANKILKNLLMMFRRDAWSGIRHAYFHAVRPRQPEPPPLFHRSQRSHTSFPEVRRRPQCHGSPARSMLQRVIEQIRGRLLHLLVIETKCRN